MAKQIDLNKLSDAQLKQYLDTLEKKARKERRLVKGLEHEVSTQMPSLAGGNIRDINKIIWPFFFGTKKVIVPPGETVNSFTSITQEAAFNWAVAVRSVFERRPNPAQPDGFDYIYIDPKDWQDGYVPGLSYVITDAQSDRSFQFDPTPIDHMGFAEEPTRLETPMLVSANNVLEVKFFNEHPTKTYIPFISLYGFRIRMEDADEILGLVGGN